MAPHEAEDRAAEPFCDREMKALSDKIISFHLSSSFYSISQSSPSVLMDVRVTHRRFSSASSLFASGVFCR